MSKDAKTILEEKSEEGSYRFSVEKCEFEHLHGALCSPLVIVPNEENEGELIVEPTDDGKIYIYYLKPELVDVLGKVSVRASGAYRLRVIDKAMEKSDCRHFRIGRVVADEDGKMQPEVIRVND